MKKFIAAILSAAMCLSLAACGSNEEGEQPADKGVAVMPALQVQDISAFLDMTPDASEVDTEDGYTKLYFFLEPGTEILFQQYVDALIGGGYGLSLVDLYTKNEEPESHKFYSIKYSGEKELNNIPEDKEYHIGISVYTDTESSKMLAGVYFAEGIELIDDGHRADFSKVEKPAPTPTPVPVATATPQPAAAPAPTPAPVVEAVDKNTSPIPEFSSFLNRYPSEEKDRYYGGNRKYYQNIPLETQETVVSEVLDLLDKDRYQLELIEKVENDNKIEYNYRYTGNVSMDEIHSKNDDTRYYNLQFTVYNRYNDNGTYGIHFHYSPQFVEESAGYKVSADIANGGSGGGGGTTDFEGSDLPDHSKLQCLTCDGDGDCKTCGGSTYVGFGDARAKCGTCRGTGNCRTCGGSGTRS